MLQYLRGLAQQAARERLSIVQATAREAAAPRGGPTRVVTIFALRDKDTGRTYYYNPTTGESSYVAHWCRTRVAVRAVR